MDEALIAVEAWRVDYNEVRPHMALKDQAPTDFARATVLGRLELGH
ncbi:integrase core domain-containing protein [Pseudoduganella sp. UC29_106]